MYMSLKCYLSLCSAFYTLIIIIKPNFIFLFLSSYFLNLEFKATFSHIENLDSFSDHWGEKMSKNENSWNALLYGYACLMLFYSMQQPAKMYLDGDFMSYLLVYTQPEE